MHRTFVAAAGAGPTGSKIYEANTGGGAWSDVSGSSYSTNTEGWVFAQFGDATIATNKLDQMQASTGSTASTFAAIATAPKAKIVFTTKDFVIAANTADAAGSATYGTAPDRWWCSAFQNHTDWTPSVTTQCTTGRLIGGDGEFTAGLALGTNVVLYKKNAVFVGNYAGPPTVFDFQQIAGEYGAVGPNAVCDIGGAHFFVGDSDFWVFDGHRPVSVGAEVKDFFFDAVGSAALAKTIAVYHAATECVWVFYDTSSGSTLNNSLIFNVRTKTWGASPRNALRVAMVLQDGSLGIIGITKSLTTLTGSGTLLASDPDAANNAPTLTMWYVGDAGVNTSLREIRLQVARSETTSWSASALAYIRKYPGDPATLASPRGGSTLTDVNGVAPTIAIRGTAPWHYIAISFASADLELVGIRVPLRGAGSRSMGAA
jgi:hypothetical protein